MRRADRIALAPAVLLHARPYGETSRLLDCLVRERGRVTLVARGARRDGAALRGTLQPFQPLLLSWAQRGELGTLTGAEPAGRLPRLAGEALFAGFYANELLLRGLAADDPHPPVYDAYLTLLDGLAGGAAPGVLLRRFELALLHGLGYALEPDRCADGRPVEPGRAYRYEPESGLHGAGVGEDHDSLFAGDDLLAFAADRCEAPGAAAAARRLTRLALDHALGHRPLRTRAVLHQMRRAGARP